MQTIRPATAFQVHDYTSELKLPLLFFSAIYALRLIISSTMGLMPQDAYYYMYSEHLDLSYFDHPPMVAYMIRAFGMILGKSVLAIKITDFTVSLLTFFSFYYLSRLLLSAKRALYAVMIFGSTMMLTVVSINTTPDVPLLLFWIITLIIFWYTIAYDSWYLWILSGIFAGLSFDSKYTGLFLVFGVIVFLMISESHRKLMLSWRLPLLILAFCVVISPIVYWNISNDWLSFRFQSTSRMDSITKFLVNPKNFFGNIGLQSVILIPVFLYWMFQVGFRLVRKFVISPEKLDARHLYLLSFSVPMIIFFFGVSIFYWVKMNWIMPGYLSAILICAIYIPLHIVRYQLITSLFLHIIFLVQVVLYPVNVKSDDTWYGWEHLSTEIGQLASDYPEHFLFSADGYKTSAVLNFYQDDHTYSGNVIGKNGLQFSIIDDDLTHLQGKNAIFIDSDKNLGSEDKSSKKRDDLIPYFDSVRQLEPILIYNNSGKLLRKFLVYECSDYRATDSESSKTTHLKNRLGGTMNKEILE